MEIVEYNVTQCTKCPGVKGICHENCEYDNNEEKEFCEAMDYESGNCFFCGCHW